MKLTFENPNTEEEKIVCDRYVVSCIRTIKESENGDIPMWGLVFADENGIFERIDDITDNRARMDELLGYFRDFDVDRSQIFDVVEDFVDAMHFYL